MATLTCHSLDHGDYSLGITPVRPAYGMADPHGYTVRLARGERVAHESRPSVGREPQGHFFVYILANAFRRADLLLQRDLGFKLWTPGYADPGYGQRETAHLVVEALGLEMAMSGHLAYKTKEPRIQVLLTLLDSTSAETGLTACSRLTFYTPLGDAKEFGEQFMAECSEASRLRRTAFPADSVHDPFRATGE